MSPSRCRILKAITVLVSLQLFKIIQCKNSKHLNIPELLARSEYCQVQIVYDKISDYVLQPVSASDFHPLILVRLDIFRSPRNTVTHLFRKRNSKCKISFIVYEYYYPGNFDLRQPYSKFWMDASDYQYKSSNVFPPLHKNVYKILICAIQKSELQRIFKHPRETSLQSERMSDNFGILLLGRKQERLCVQPIGLVSKNISTMQCTETESNGNIVQLFRHLHSVPTIWGLESFRYLDMEHNMKEDLRSHS